MSNDDNPPRLVNKMDAQNAARTLILAILEWRVSPIFFVRKYLDWGKKGKYLNKYNFFQCFKFSYIAAIKNIKNIEFMSLFLTV